MALLRVTRDPFLLRLRRVRLSRPSVEVQEKWAWAEPLWNMETFNLSPKIPAETPLVCSVPNVVVMLSIRPSLLGARLYANKKLPLRRREASEPTLPTSLPIAPTTKLWQRNDR